MNTNKILAIFAIFIILSLAFTACGGGGQPLNEEQQLATIVAATMTAMSAGQSDSVSAPETTGQLRPLADNCADLKGAIEASLGVAVTVETVPVEMSWSGETGSACQLTGIGDGNNFENVMDVSTNMQGMLRIHGWQGSMKLPCLGYGGAGPEADQSCYLYKDKACESMITHEPIDMKLCDTLEGPIGVCLAALPPEQRKFTVRLTCAEGSASMAPGHINGQAQMLDPHTPAMTIYALNPATSEWFSVETFQNEGPFSFTLDVAPGSYQIFSSLGTGYATADGWSLVTVTVESGQTISDVIVRPPGQSECGSMFGVPASPDGLHPATVGATDECIANLTLPKTEPTRIEFAVGATSAQMQGSIGPQGLGQYVLYAMQGQVMTVNLYPSRPTILVIWGLDGTVLISDHAGATSWSGPLPLTQEYYIDVRSLSGETSNYTLGVSIPPPGNTTSGSVYPKIEPFSDGLMQRIVAHTVPPMLPPEFPIQAGQPEIVPYLLSAREGEYEASLDYGYECQGIGYCHYGVITGMQTASPVPVGTSLYPFEADRAEQVNLEKGITGYFVDATCGANCNDSQVWWIYGGYQYSIGLKAGPRDMVVALANAAITNSMP
ncbi:MAG: hypothetical protein MUO77_15360 [Anaerolineales bacterium]|nr:hypothetical protein [Anaerolineales bacterium]